MSPATISDMIATRREADDLREALEEIVSIIESDVSNATAFEEIKKIAIAAIAKDEDRE